MTISEMLFLMIREVLKRFRDSRIEMRHYLLYILLIYRKCIFITLFLIKINWFNKRICIICNKIWPILVSIYRIWCTLFLFVFFLYLIKLLANSIILNYENNYVKTLDCNNNTKNLNISAINLSIQHNYFQICSRPNFYICT